MHISPSPFSSGLSIRRSVPGIAHPAEVKLNFVKVWTVVAPVDSLMPYKLNSGISSDAKYCIEDYFKGAAPKKKTSHWSNPIAYLIFERIKKFANEYIKGTSVLFINASTWADPYPFAQVDIFVAIAGAWEAASLSFSSNFSHTLGTAKKTVGRACFRVSTNVP